MFSPAEVEHVIEICPLDSIALPNHEAVDATAVVLRNGSMITLSVAANLITLDHEDRKWLFELIDKFAEYERISGGRSIQPTEAAVEGGDDRQ